jgi:hypothetical protein
MKLRHPRIVGLFGAVLDQTQPMIVMEFCEFVS